jgi:hypothetical protein
MAAPRTALAFGLLSTLALGCAGGEAPLERPGRGTIGEELYGVLCDRIGAQALPEDLYGLSFVDGCHRMPNGDFADAVKTDASVLPELVDGAKNLDGASVSLADQTEHRRLMVARIEALFRHRTELIRAFDAIFPGDLQVIAKDLTNADPTQSCDVPASGSTVRLGDALEDFLSRIVPMYDDGTLPQGTRSLARVFEGLVDASDAHDVFARIQGRSQYRPIATAVGVARPVAAYPRLRALANAGLSLFSPEVKLRDGTVLYPAGKAFGTLTASMNALYQELRTATAEAPEPKLVATSDTSSERQVLSRPRTKSELLRELVLFEDTRLGGTTSSFIAARDSRGFVKLAGPVAAPFVDRDGDALPDVDAKGAFVTSDGKPAPQPFYVSKPSDRAVDTYMRPLTAPGGALVYAYVDTRHTLAAEVIATIRPLVAEPEAGKSTALWDALGGAKVLAGARVKKTKTYAADPQLAKDWAKTHPGEAPPADLTTAPVRLTYDSIDPAKSPLLDLVHALTFVLGDESADDVLHLTQSLLAKNPNAVARVAKALLDAREAVAKHPEAKLPENSLFWDELLDVVTNIVAPTDGRQDLLPEKMIDALTDNESAKLGGIYANYMRYRDELSYDRANINGQAYNVTESRVIEMRNDVDRTKADTGTNRSSFQRFLQLIHDTNNVTACNKAGASIFVPSGTLGAVQFFNVTLPVFGTYKECEVFKIENMAKFYVDAMVGKAEMYLRDNTLRDGLVAGLGAANVNLMSKLSNIEGFFGADGVTVLANDSSERTLRPTPKFLDRLVFFDTPNDSQNARTQRFMRDLIGDNGFGTSVCPARTITDPLPSAPDAASDGRVRNLRNCDVPDLIRNRDPNTIFVWERFGFFGSMRPLLSGFVQERRQERFLDLLEVMHKHWQTSAAAASTTGTAECLLDRPTGATCTGDGISSYEPLLIEILNGDTLPALVELQKAAKATSIARCTEYDATTRQCKPGKTVTKTGTAVLAQALRALASPVRAKALGVTYRDGNDKALRNDGTRTRQVTPLDLIVDALKGFDAAFAASGDPKRLEGWRRARSIFADTAFKTTGTGAATAFESQLLPVAGPRLVALLREQLAAHCPPASTGTSPAPLCTWAKTEMPKKVEDLLTSPLAASLLDVGEVVRSDAAAKNELDSLVRYLLDPTSPHDALASMLAGVADFAQVLGDDANLVPLLHVAAFAAAPTLRDANDQVVLASVTDGQLALLRRMAARVYDENEKEICAREMDPLDLASGILERLVTPMKRADGSQDRTPFEVIADVVADVNRLDASRRDPLDAPDYGKLSSEVLDFLTNPKRGLEQFYAIVTKGLR